MQTSLDSERSPRHNFTQKGNAEIPWLRERMQNSFRALQLGALRHGWRNKLRNALCVFMTQRPFPQQQSWGGVKVWLSRQRIRKCYQLCSWGKGYGPRVFLNLFRQPIDIVRFFGWRRARRGNLGCTFHHLASNNGIRCRCLECLGITCRVIRVRSCIFHLPTWPGPRPLKLWIGCDEVTRLPRLRRFQWPQRTS